MGWCHCISPERGTRKPARRGRPHARLAMVAWCVAAGAIAQPTATAPAAGGPRSADAASISASGPPFALVTPDAPTGAMLARAQANSARNCGGENISPPLSWQRVPVGAKSLALLLFDPDGQQGAGVVHWLRYGIPPDVLAFETGTGEQDGHSILPGAGGRNSAGTDVYAGPCPPVGETPHHYVFQLFALDLAPDALPPGLDRMAFLAASRGHVLGYTSTLRRYAR